MIQILMQSEDNGLFADLTWTRVITAVVVLIIGFIVASAARWSIRRFGKKQNAVTSTVQILGRLVYSSSSPLLFTLR